MKYFVKQFPEVALCLVIKIYIGQKNDIYPHHFTNMYLYYVFCSLETLHFKKCKEFGEKEYYPIFKGVLPGSFDKVYLDQH